MSFKMKLNSFEECIAFAKNIVLIEFSFDQGLFDNLYVKENNFGDCDYDIAESHITVFSFEVDRDDDYSEFNLCPSLELIRYNKKSNEFIYNSKNNVDAYFHVLDDINEEAYFQLSTVHDMDIVNAFIIMSYVHKHCKRDFFFDLDFYQTVLDHIESLEL